MNKFQFQMPKERPFKFVLGQVVGLQISDEYGCIAGRAQYLDDENRYLLQYQDGNGCAHERWFPESLLAAAESDDAPGSVVLDSRFSVPDLAESLGITTGIH